MATDTTQQQLQQALELIRAGRKEEAYKILNPLLQADPNNFNAWWLMANTVTDPQYVRMALDNVVRLRPDYAPARQKLDELNRQTGQAPAAPPPTTGVYGSSPPQTGGWGTAPVPPAPQSSTSHIDPGITTPEAPPTRFTPLNLLLGLLLGLVGAGVAGAVWVGIVIATQTQYGIVAILVGVIVGAATLLGAGRKPSVVMALFSVLITLATMAMSQYFIERHFLIQEIAGEGITVETPFFLPVDIETTVEDEIWGQVAIDEENLTFYIPVFFPLNNIFSVIVESLKADAVTLVFWGLALVAAFFIPFRGRFR